MLKNSDSGNNSSKENKSGTKRKLNNLKYQIKKVAESGERRIKAIIKNTMSLDKNKSINMKDQKLKTMKRKNTYRKENIEFGWIKFSFMSTIDNSLWIDTNPTEWDWIKIENRKFKFSDKWVKILHNVEQSVVSLFKEILKYYDADLKTHSWYEIKQTWFIFKKTEVIPHIRYCISVWNLDLKWEFTSCSNIIYNGL